VNEQRLFDEFLERCCERGDATIPVEWPEALKKRCLFFAKMISPAERDGSGPRARSIVSSFEDEGVSASLSLAGEDAAPPAQPARGGERYVVEREIGKGGMGRVLLAYDRDFRRRVAMKTLLGSAESPARLSRFLEEAQATAQLEHPNIAPVYDLGKEASGAPFFTMKWIRGRDLKEILDAKDPDRSLIGLVQILQQAAMGVHFANSRGVIHRDLKPHNVMVGDYGEVLVVDWGLAKILGRKDPDAAPAAEGPPSTERGDEGRFTIEGSVQGSPAYMSPEQARGEVREIDARTDVFGLGAILYEILTSFPPYDDASSQVATGKARRGAVVPPSARAPDRAIPAALDAICGKALAPQKSDRFQSAREFHDALQRYVEGTHDAERRAAEAARLRAAADRMREALREAEAREAEVCGAEAELRLQLSDHEPEGAKVPLWELQAKRHSAREEASAAFNRATAAYQAVLSIDAKDALARSALAEIFFEKLAAAEDRGDRDAAQLYEGMVEQYGAERFRIELEGRGLVKLSSEPTGASVYLSRYEERGPLLVESAPVLLGETPVEKPLPRGSYLAVLRRPDSIDTRYPFIIDRCGSHEAHIRLLDEGSLPEGFVHVPGGLTIVGGHDRDVSALARERVHVQDLVVGIFPVTLGEYCRFLNAELAQRGSVMRDLIPAFEPEEYVTNDRKSGFVPIERLGPQCPAISLTFKAIDSYLTWVTASLGKAARILKEVEWERCARGADGRIYPWGNGFDWALTKGGPSRGGKPFPEPVGAFPRDASPFEVRDMAGSVRELVTGPCAAGYRPCRGGSWLNAFPLLFRADSRTTRAENTRSTDAGMRVCYDFGRSNLIPRE
jgi:formylglycine-generating enzyme required for sulfatase activity/predicted Ser/Thr protein kinase